MWHTERQTAKKHAVFSDIFVGMGTSDDLKASTVR